MNWVHLRFFGPLNDFLKDSQKQVDFKVPFRKNQSIKDLIESRGVPHPEVDRIHCHGTRIDFDYLVKPGDRFLVYPIFVNFDLEDKSSFNHLSEKRFLCDIHLNRLARYLRLCGFDTEVASSQQQEREMALVAMKTQRMILSRDRRLLMLKEVKWGYYVRSHRPKDQLFETATRFGLTETLQPFKYCLQCNGIIQPIAKEDVLHILEPLTKKYFEEFFQCHGCGQVYWKGGHYERMLAFLKSIGEN